MLSGRKKRTHDGKDVRTVNDEQRINDFNDANKPFYIVAHDDGIFSLCLTFTFLDGEYADYGQEAFNRYAQAIGDPVMEGRLYTHGSGYEWEAAFRQAFADDPNIGRILFDCEAGGFFCSCDNLSILEDLGRRFKDICEDTERFVPVIAEGIKNAEAGQAEQERLLRTVRGRLMEQPRTTYEIQTPDGSIRLTPDDNQRLLNGEMRYVKIGGIIYAAYELLDQEIVADQIDLFDNSLIKLKTEEPRQELTPSATM